MKPLTRIAALLIFLTASCIVATAQNSPAPSPATSSTTASGSAPVQTVTREQALDLLMQETVVNRNLIAAQRERISSLEAEAQAERERGDSLSASYQLAVREIATLRRAVEMLERASAIYQQVITTLTGERDEARADARRSRRRERIATIIAVGSIIIRFL